MCEKGLEHLDSVNFDKMNNDAMEEWHSLWDSAVLDGDSLHGGSAINGWGLGLETSSLI